jgi:hypothetical protein
MESDSTLIHFDVDKYLMGLYHFVVAKFRDLVAGLSRQMARDSADLRAIEVEQDQLRESHLRFLELSEQAQPKQERLEIAVGLLLNMPVKDNPTAEVDFNNDWGITSLPLPVDANRLDISKFALWKVVREIVRQTSEIRMIELENALNKFGAKATRSAIDSALTVHKNEFHVFWRGREKYVSLATERNKTDAASTKRRKRK